MGMRSEELGMRNKQGTMSREQRTKRRGFFPLLFVSCYLLFVSCYLLFVLACQNQFDMPKLEKPAAGNVGYVSLSIAGNGRTIMPTTGLEASLFNGYTLVFSAQNFESITFEKTNDNLGTAITLPVGTWDLEITAYKVEGETKLPLARGNVTGIAITSGGTTSQSVELKPITSNGTGTFSWDITFPDDIISASMTITPLTTGGSAAQTLWLKDTSEVNTVTTDTSITLNAGVYRAALTLSNGAAARTRAETLHVYRNMDSVYTDDFAGIFDITYVVSGADTDTPGTLRYAITKALTDSAPANSAIFIDDNVKTISLTSALPQITKSINIEGNGVTLTRDASWTSTDNYSQLLYINSTTAEVNISRVWFKDGRATDYGAAVGNIGGTVTLESCIFSGNQTSAGAAYGGAIYNDGTLTVKGCTFYQNKCTNTTGNGGAIYVRNGTLTLTGNLFYGNTASYGPAVYRNNGTVTSGGYNVVDVALGTTSAQAGWTAVAETEDNADKSIGTAISDLPISGKTFKLLSGSEAAGVITTLPADYPTVDFYGNAITASAAAGAVQGITGSGYYVDLSLNNPLAGTVNAPELDADGLGSGSITLTATANSGSLFNYWLVDGAQQTANPLSLTISSHAKIQAVFTRSVSVTSSADDAATSGTLRSALTNAQDRDIISINAGLTIQLTGALPQITKSITIEGNGLTLTRDAGWTATDTTSQLLYIAGSAAAQISRVWFKDGRVTNYGAAVRNSGTLTLESCIFSGNQTSGSGAYGGAIYSTGTLTVKGCTFYQNKCTNTTGYGGAIYVSSGTFTLTGNLFYGNTAPSGPAVYRNNGTVTSGGYNVVDVALGTGDTQAGWTAGTGDKLISSLPISVKTFKLISGSAAAGVITTLPADYPAKDFYGNTITAAAAAGAVQGSAGSGYYIDLSLNNPEAGTVNVSPAPDEDGLGSGSITLTATANSGYSFGYWLVDGAPAGSDNPLTITITGHTKVQAVFTRTVSVTSSADSGADTLRRALTNAQDGDIISINTGLTIELTDVLPQITKSITIEGNGVTLTRAASWTTTSPTSQLLYINSASAVVNISRVWFKDGRATDYGAAIRNAGGTVTLESCIFSGNQTSANNAWGGAIHSTGTLTVKGCTFYQNKCTGTGTATYPRRGGAIYNTSGTLTLTGNLFYGNTATEGPVVYRSGGTVTSGGYNVVDVDYGTTNDTAGWAVGTGDKTVAELLGDNATSPFSVASPVNAADFAPVADVQNVMPGTAIDGFPTADFNGNDRDWPGAAGAVK